MPDINYNELKNQLKAELKAELEAELDVDVGEREFHKPIQQTD